MMRTSMRSHAVAAERLDFLLLQHAQQLALQRQRHVADLVQQQRATISGLELAVAPLALGAGVGAGRHTEELGLEQGFGHGGDVHADEGFGGACTRGMDTVRQQLLAGAGLAEQQDGRIGHRHAPRLALDLHRRGAAADEAGDAVLGPALRRELRARGVQFALQPAELGHQRLHRAFGLVQQHHAEGADDFARRVAQRQPADQEGAGLVAEQVHQDRLAGVDDLRHQRVRNHLLDTLADKGLGAVEA